MSSLNQNLASFVSKEILNQPIIKDLPDRERIIQALNQYLRLQENNFIDKKAYSYFTAEWLAHFVATGRSSIVPDAIYRPLNVPEKMKILLKMLPFVQGGQYKLVKKDLSKLDINFHISLHNETTAALYVKNSKNKMVIALLEDPKLFSIFKAFFKHIETYNYFYALEDTIEVLNKALMILRQMDEKGLNGK